MSKNCDFGRILQTLGGGHESGEVEGRGERLIWGCQRCEARGGDGGVRCEKLRSRRGREGCVVLHVDI